MKAEEKALKKIARSERRRTIRNEKYFNKIRSAKERGYYIPLHAVDKNGYAGGSWLDSNSPTGYSQVCSYEAYGTCQSPCTGDC